MGETFPALPEFFETEFGESLAARTETLASFRELGPPDLCQVVKSNGRASVSSYHFVSGVDASSSAALAAYINSLGYETGRPSSWLSTSWGIRSGTYCCFNAFTRKDVRVQITIPGGVDAYVVDLRGEHHDPSPQTWQEVYVSALLRSIHCADDPHYRFAGYRKLNPITSPEDESRFLQASENLFFQGWQLGSDPEIQVATVAKNHLANGLLKYFGQANRSEVAVNLFEKLYAREPQCAALVAQAYLNMNEEMKAVAVMHDALVDAAQGSMPSESYALLHVQADFLRRRGEVEWAREVALAAVKCAPSEFTAWAHLTQSHMDLGQWEDVLCTLNSGPMFTFEPRDLHRMPPPHSTNLPIKPFIADSGVLAEDPSSNGVAQSSGVDAPLSILAANAQGPAAAGESDADIVLLRLPAPLLRGTFAQAYSLLADLVARIGWDELLKRRSNVFFMEEDYRVQKSKQKSQMENDPKHDSPSPSEEGQISQQSPRIFKTPRDTKLAPVPDGDHPQSPIPTIMISPGSDAGDSEQDYRSSFDADISQVPRPEAARQEDTSNEEAETRHPETGAAIQDASDGHVNEAHAETQECTFNDRRLCERWLDNLFMVLYEDLRVYTIWRAETEHFMNIRKAYIKTSLEWEILGDLALRLHHPFEAKEAYLRCLDVSGSAPNGVGAPGHWSAGFGGAGSSSHLPSSSTVALKNQQGHRFSARAHYALLDMYTAEGDVRRAVWVAVKLTAYHHRWYAECSYPGAVGKALFALIQAEGLAKVSYTLVSLDPPTSILRLMQNYFAYAQLFHVPGWDF